MNEAEASAPADRPWPVWVARIRPDQWGDTAIPPDFARRGEDGPLPTLRSIVKDHAYDDAWVPDMLAGGTMEEAGAEKFDGDLLGDHPVEKPRGDRGRGALMPLLPSPTSTWSPTFLRRLHPARVPRQINSLPWPAGARDRQGDRGSSSDLPPELVQGIWDEVSPPPRSGRTIGASPAAVPVPGQRPVARPPPASPAATRTAAPWLAQPRWC